MTWILPTRYGSLLATAMVLGLAVPAARADEDAELRTKALALNNITGTDPIKGEIVTLLEDAAGTKKLLKTAAAMAKEKEQPFNYNAAHILARVSLALREPESSAVFHRLCIKQAIQLKSAEKLGESYLGMLGLIDLYYASRKYDETAKLCQEVLEFLEKERTGQRLKDEVLRRMIQAVARSGKTDEADKLLANLLKVRKDDWRNLEIKAWLKNEQGQSDEAAQIYEDLLEKIGKDKALEQEERDLYIAQFHYILSGVYVDMNQIDKAAAHLKTLLAKNPDNPTYNNDLGYIWADHDMNLDEAEQMIRKALDEDRKQRRKNNPDVKPEEDKDSAAYLDSLGWVLYKKKQYKDAKPFLLQAVEDKDEGQHLEIYDHLGDVHMALGEKADAIAAWKKAVEVAGTSKREKEKKELVEKKLKETK
jgi:tetratricopeptide (TPR) repeat protein